MIPPSEMVLNWMSVMLRWEDEPELPPPQHLQIVKRIQNQVRFKGRKPPQPQRRK